MWWRCESRWPARTQRRANGRCGPAAEMTQEVVRHYIENPAQLGSDTPPEDRHAIAGATLDRIEAVGLDLVLHRQRSSAVWMGKPSELTCWCV
jgi:hypothetical protein